jgi:hypothetical protein
VDATQFRTFHEAVQTKRSPIQRRRSSLSTIEPVDTASDHKLDNATWRAYDLTAVHFEHALELSAIAPHDRIVLERLFTIMDRSGDDVVNSLELLIAMALLVRGPFNAKLECTCSPYLTWRSRPILNKCTAAVAVDCLVQHLHDKPLTPAHLVFLVSTMTTVANCFGDPLLPLPVLEAIADDVFEELSGLSGAAPECDSSPAVSVAVQALAAHPFMQEYISQDKSAWSPR